MTNNNQHRLVQLLQNLAQRFLITGILFLNLAVQQPLLAKSLEVPDRPCDTIYTKDGRVILAVSTEIGQKSIFYHHPDSTTTKLLKIRKNKIKRIGWGLPDAEDLEEDKAEAMRRIKWSALFTMLMVGFILLGAFASVPYILLGMLLIVPQFIFTRHLNKFVKKRPYLEKERRTTKMLYLPVKILALLMLIYTAIFFIVFVISLFLFI